MIQAMYNGVSGLRAHKTELDVIGNNIANINTTGFKSSRVNFREMLSQTIRGASAPTTGGTGGTNPVQIGLGTGVASIDVSQTQGSLLPTGSSTDVAIEGNGFFVLGDGQGKFFTRDGSFKLDGDGNLVSSGSGLKVLGWSADPSTGIVDDTRPISANSSIRLPIGRLAVARQTTTITFGGNLDANSKVGTVKPSTANVFDSLGVAHDLSIDYTKLAAASSQAYADAATTLGTGTLKLRIPSGTTASVTLDATNNTLQGVADAINGLGGNFSAEVVDDGATAGAGPFRLVISDTANNESVTVDANGITGIAGNTPEFGTMWSWQASSKDAVAGADLGSGTIVFDSKGKASLSSGNITLELANPMGAKSPIDVKLSFMPITQIGGDQNPVKNTADDGLPLGMLNDFTIGKDGVITGAFTNGMTQSLGRIALGIFSNPAGLERSGNNLLVETPNTGVAEISGPGKGSVGKLTSGFLESSNVDLPTEFANMIVAQRGFQANSRIITTSDEVLQDIVQLKR